MKKFIIAVIVVIILGAIFYVYYKNEAKAPTVENNTPAQSAQNPAPVTAPPQAPAGAAATSGETYTPPQSPGGGENLGSNIQVYEVDFGGKSYSPSAINLNVGDYIFFKNKSTGDFWPIAGSANTLGAYPNFNPPAPIPAGGEYKFQFTKAGQWSFGDNLIANAVFTVNVVQ